MLTNILYVLDIKCLHTHITKYIDDHSLKERLIHDETLIYIFTLTCMHIYIHAMLKIYCICINAYEEVCGGAWLNKICIFLKVKKLSQLFFRNHSISNTGFNLHHTRGAVAQLNSVINMVFPCLFCCTKRRKNISPIVNYM